MSASVTAADTGLLILRVVFGLILVAHAYSKRNISATAAFFESIGLKPGALQARVAVGTEIVAGLAFAAGLLTPIAAAFYIALMLVAAWTVHRGHGFFITNSGWEYNVALGAGAASVAALGAGKLSLDWVLFESPRV